MGAPTWWCCTTAASSPPSTPAPWVSRSPPPNLTPSKGTLEMVPMGRMLWAPPGNLPDRPGWTQLGKICLPWCVHRAGRMELLFQAGLPVNVKEHLKMHFKHRNEGLCSGSLSPAMCHFLNSPNLPDTSRKLSLRTQLLQLHMPVSHTMTNRTDLNTWGYNSNPDTNNTNCPGYHLTVHRILSLFILSRFYRNPPQSSELFPSVIHKGNKLTPKSQWFVQSSALNIFAV